MPRLLPFLVACLLCVGPATSRAFAADPLSPDAALRKEFEPLLDDLFHSLNPDLPGVPQMQNHWKEGQTTEAFAQLLDLAGKPATTTSVPALPPAHEALLERARAATENRFRILEQWIEPPRTASGTMDWHYRGPTGDKEVAWMLNRHRPFLDLAAAWESTRNPAYRESLNRLFQDWIRANPYPDGLTFSPPWRALETARRILEVWPVLAASDALDAHSRLLLLASLLQHADALRHHASFWGGNHLITEKMALLQLAVSWPVFQQTAAWRQHAVEVLSQQFLQQSYPDGSYKELSNHYQRVVLRNARRFLRLLATTDPQFRQRPVYRRIVAMWDFFAGAIRPDGTGPLNNASDVEPNAAVLQRVAAFHGRRDWRYIATGGTAGTQPEPPHHRLFPYAGQVFLRNNWTPSGDWIYFDAGPYGTAHQHVDRLHVSAVLNGRPLLTDSGRYHYRPGPLKDFFTGPAGHASLLLDGQPPIQAPRAVRQPLPLRFDQSGKAAFVSARAAFPHPPSRLTAPDSWDRCLVYHPDGFLLIVDSVTTFSPRSVTFRFPFHPQNSTQEATAALRPIAPAETGPLHLEVLKGHYSPQYNQKQPSTVLAFSGRIQQPTTFVWLLQDPADQPRSFGVVTESPDFLRLRRLPDGTVFSIPLHHRSPHPFQLHRP